MKTKKDFQEAAIAEISNYPRAAELYRVRDPNIMASLDAMAAMLAMAVAETNVAAAEPFTKARDMTVKADAAAKGVLPFGLSAEMAMIVANGNDAPFVLATGRKLLDSQGRAYVVRAGATVPAGDSATVTVVQQSTRQFDHTVAATLPFYQIEVPKAAEGKSITGVRVIGPDNTEFEYRPEYVNLLAGDKTFHLQSDAEQRLYVEFGAEGLAGYGAQAGDVFTVIVTECDGDAQLGAGSKFAFEYSGVPAETKVTMTLDEVLSVGRGVLDVPTLRKIASYPSIYDTSAVYLGNFDFLVRRNLSPFRFLSVWNEQTEEQVRGADVANINTLFVAAIKDGVDDTSLRQQIRDIILTTDDSYRVKDVLVEEVEIPVVITAKVHSVYDFAQVEQQIREQVLANYGRDSAFSQQGQNKVLYRRVYSLLTSTVPALQGERADLEVEIDDDVLDIKPEQFRYVSANSLTVTVEQAQ